MRPRVGGNARRDARARMVASVKAKGSALAHLDGRYILRLSVTHAGCQVLN